jgi:single-stranded DNA-binding protein
VSRSRKEGHGRCGVCGDAGEGRRKREAAWWRADKKEIDMSNNFTAVVNLGADPETLTLGEREVRKLRCADKARGKKAITRWFNVLVNGKDCETADRLRKGDTILVTGELALTEYTPKGKKGQKGKGKAEAQRADEMPFGKILQVIKSPTFFGEAEAEEGEAAGDYGDGVVEIEAPDLDAEGPAEDPLSGIDY